MTECGHSIQPIFAWGATASRKIVCKLLLFCGGGWSGSNCRIWHFVCLDKAESSIIFDCESHGLEAFAYETEPWNGEWDKRTLHHVCFSPLGPWKRTWLDVADMCVWRFVLVVWFVCRVEVVTSSEEKIFLSYVLETFQLYAKWIRKIC